MSHCARATMIVADPNLDYRRMILEISRTYPKAICDAAARLESVGVDWLGEVRRLIQKRQKLPAIRLYRTNSGASLVVSRRAVEEIMQEMEVK